MSHSAMRTSGYFSDEQVPAQHAASRHYGAADGDAPHVCEFCSPETKTITAAPRGRHSAGVRRWGSQEAEWHPES
jgi:hypothetical protein